MLFCNAHCQQELECASTKVHELHSEMNSIVLRTKMDQQHSRVFLYKYYWNYCHLQLICYINSSYEVSLVQHTKKIQSSAVQGKETQIFWIVYIDFKLEHEIIPPMLYCFGLSKRPKFSILITNFP